jgi:AhpD family alkylhydroperoxidase
MSRIPLANMADLDPALQEMITQVEALTGDSTALLVMAHRPQMLTDFATFYWNLQTNGLLDRKLVELVRLGIAQINRCPNCLATRYQDSIDQGLTEDMVSKLPNVENAGEFSERERAAIAFGQKMASNHWSVGDDDFSRLYAHFSTNEIVELNVLIAQFIGIGRMFAVVDAMNPVCDVRLPMAANA